MVTRAEYIKIADAVKQSRNVIGMFSTDDESTANRLIGVAVVAERIADVLADDNPRFNRDRFLDACGLA